MRILSDESLPRRLRGALPGHAAAMVTEQGWSGLDNGDLLRAASPSFDVFLTADQNLQYQQNLDTLPMAVVVLVAQDNTFETMQPLMAKVLEELPRLQPRTLIRVEG